MGSPSLILVLIAVVWAIVLAPMLVGKTKPIRRAGEGYDCLLYTSDAADDTASV